jgi:hypothetical protein
MDFLTEVEFQSSRFPEVKIHLRRISLARRLRFLAKNFELMRLLKMRESQPGPDAQETQNFAEAEIELSRRILAETVQGLEGVSLAGQDPIDWLLQTAPNELCVEVLQRAGEEMILGESLRKK